MAFTSFTFPPSTPVFPRAVLVQNYLESYAAHFNLTPHIRFETAVQVVQRDTSKWKVQISTGETLDFDLVIVGNGHYRIPRYPDTPGLSEWFTSGKASHAAWYRRPHDLGNTVMVVGAGPSGKDIVAEMRTVARVVIHSSTGTTAEDIGNLKLRGRVTRFGGNGQVMFEDGSTESGIDHCILATGYEMSFPFFSSNVTQHGLPPPAPPLPRELYNSTYHVFPLAKHMFPLQAKFPPSSLAFIGLLVKVAPFPLLEAQACAVMHAFARPDALEATREAVDIITRYEQLREELGDDSLSIAKAWHRFKDHEQFDYRDRMYEFAASSMGEGQRERIIVPEWQKEMYNKKDVLRRVWIKLVKSGEADEWVKGVGENGSHEWIDLLKKMLRRAKEADEHVSDVEGSDKLKL